MFRSSNLTLMVGNLEEAVQFYVNRLGLTLKARHGDHWAEVQAPGLTIGLHPGQEGDGNTAPQPRLSIGFEVDDLERVMSTLKNRGVTFSSQLIEGKTTRTIYFSDPDQTPLYLYQMVKSGQATGAIKDHQTGKAASRHLGALEEDMTYIKPPVVAWPHSGEEDEAAHEKPNSYKEITSG